MTVVRLNDYRDGDPAWLKTCLMGDTGKPLPVLANALIGLRAECRTRWPSTRWRAPPC